MLKRILHLPVFMVFLFSGTYGQNQIQYNDTSYFIPFDKDFNLIMSASKGHLDNVRSLILQGADINAVTIDNISPLMYATENGDFLMVGFLLKSGANPNLRPFNGVTALISASRLNYLEIAELLINNGADINATDQEGVTSLHYAAAYNYVDMVKMLLYYKADPQKPDKKGNIPIVTAAWNNAQESILFLVENGVSINSQDKFSFTPLMVSVQRGNSELAEKILTYAPEINAANEGGMTALAFAVLGKDYNLSKKLIDKGADVNHMISGSKNILELAREQNDEDIIDLLLASNARPSRSPHFSQLGIGPAIHFNGDDFMTSIHGSLHESKYNAAITGGFSLRPSAVRVLTDPENDTLYQFWERRYTIYAGIEKRFSLLSRGHSLQTGPYAALYASYSFGGYRGSSSHPNPKLLPSPQLGWFLMNNHISLLAGYQYLNLGISSISPHQVNLSFAYKINLQSKKLTEKKIEWLIFE